jgi:conjugative relaxase-like TrwC/TraI family protein
MPPIISALDLTFSVEKDLSTLWMLGDERWRLQLEIIVDVAINETLAWAEKQVAVVRRGEGGIAHHSASGVLSIEIDHQTARPVNGLAAPHLHRHVVIMNLAEEDGAWTALDATRLFDLQKAVGAIAGQRIRQLTEERLGLTWERDGSNVFRVEGFDAGLRNRLSLRQQQILDKALNDGLDITNRDDWVSAQRTSREGKNACGNDPMATQWAIDMLLAEGITYDTVMTSITTAQRASALAAEDRVWIDANFPTPPIEILAARDWRFAVARALATHKLAGTLTDRVHTDPLSTLADVPPAWDELDAAMAIETRSRDALIHDAMLTVGREHSTWRRKDLIIALCDVDVPLVDAEREATAFLAGAESVYLYGEEDDPAADIRVRTVDQELFATTETREKEALLLAAVRSGVNSTGAVTDATQFQTILDVMAQRGKIISADSDQHAMSEALLLGRNRIHLIVGQAGSGKSSGVEELAIAQELGYLGDVAPSVEGGVTRLRLVGCALAANAAEKLEEESGIKSYSIAMLLSRLRTGAVVLEEGAVSIVDECSQASTAQLADLWEHVNATKGRLILMGDTRQLQAISAGGMFSEVMDTIPDATTLLDETRRQRNLDERAVLATLHDCVGVGTLREQSVKALSGQGVDKAFLAQLKKGRLGAVKAWYEANDRIRFHSTPQEAAAAIAQEYWDAVEATGGDAASAALVLAKTNSEIQILDNAVITEAVARQHLDPTAIIEFGRRSFLRDQRVVVRKVDRRIDVLNGQVGAVEDVQTVNSRWDVTYDSPNVYSTSRVSTKEVAVGATLGVTFTPRQVKNERQSAATYLSRRSELLAGALSRLEVAEASDDSARIARALAMVEKRSDEVDAALKWHEWADTLPVKGGDVPLAVSSVAVKEQDERLVVRLDDGSRRYLPAPFVTRFLDSGYAVTTQRGQGQTVEHGIEYGQVSYVGMSRGRASNIAHLVVPDADLSLLAKEQEALTPTKTWLAKSLGDGPAEVMLGEAAAQLRAGQLPSPVPIVNGVEVTVRGDASAATMRIAQEAAQAHRIGERTVAVAKTRAMASDLSDAAVAHLVATGGGTRVSTSIHDRLWTRDMPVVMARGAVNGLVRGETYHVAAVSSTFMFIETDNGKRVELSADQVRDHLDSGLALTTEWAQLHPVNADKIVAHGSGLIGEDLEWLASQKAPVEIVILDPVVASERARKKVQDEKVMELLKRDSGAGWRTRSAHAMVRDAEGQEIGLASLQQEVKLSSRAIDKVRTLVPRDLARQDLELEMIRLRKKQADLTAKLDLVAPGSDEVDYTNGLQRCEQELAQLDVRYEVLVSNLADAEPSIAAEIARSAELHSVDAKRLVEADKRIRRYVQARVTHAMKHPQPYHRLPVDPDLDSISAQARRLELLTMTEEYRTRWGILDPENALGPVPTADSQLEEWAALAREIGIDESPAYEPNL